MVSGLIVLLAWAPRYRESRLACKTSVAFGRSNGWRLQTVLYKHSAFQAAEPASFPHQLTTLACHQCTRMHHSKCHTHPAAVLQFPPCQRVPLGNPAQTMPSSHKVMLHAAIIIRTTRPGALCPGNEQLEHTGKVGGRGSQPLWTLQRRKSLPCQQLNTGHMDSAARTLCSLGYTNHASNLIIFLKLSTPCIFISKCTGHYTNSVHNLNTIRKAQGASPKCLISVHLKCDDTR